MLNDLFRNFDRGLSLTKRLIFEGEKPSAILSEFAGKDISETQDFNVDQAKDQALGRLKKAAQDNKEDSTKGSYKEAADKIGQHAEELKAKQKYFKELTKAKAGDPELLNAPNIANGQSYVKSVGRLEVLYNLLQLKPPGLDGPNFGELSTKNKEANQKWLTGLATDIQGKIAKLNEDMAQLGKEDSKVTMEDLKKQRDTTEALMKEYDVAKSKNFAGLTADLGPALTSLSTDFYEVNNLLKAKDSGDKQWEYAAIDRNKVRTNRAEALSWKAKLESSGQAGKDALAKLGDAQAALDQGLAQENTYFKGAADSFRKAADLYKAAYEKLNNEDGSKAAKQKLDELRAPYKDVAYAADIEKAAGLLVKEAEDAISKKDFVTAKAKYEAAYDAAKKVIDDNSLESPKNDQQIKKATEAMNAQKGACEGKLAAVPEMKFNLEFQINKLPIEGKDKQVIFANLNERTRIYTQYAATIDAYLSAKTVVDQVIQKDKLRANIGDKNERKLGYGEFAKYNSELAFADAAFRRGDFADAINKYQEAAKLLQKHLDTPADKKQMVVENGVLVEVDKTKIKAIEGQRRQLLNEFFNNDDVMKLIQPQRDSFGSYVDAMGQPRPDSFGAYYEACRQQITVLSQAKNAMGFRPAELNKPADKLKADGVSASVIGMMDTANAYFREGNFDAARRYYQSAGELYRKEKIDKKSS